MGSRKDLLPGTGTSFATTGLNDTITGTTSGTFYDIYVQSICGVGDTSGASVVSFNTSISNDDACNAIMVPVDGSVNLFTSAGATVQPGEPGTLAYIKQFGLVLLLPLLEM